MDTRRQFLILTCKFMFGRHNITNIMESMNNTHNTKKKWKSKYFASATIRFKALYIGRARLLSKIDALVDLAQGGCAEILMVILRTRL